MTQLSDEVVERVARSICEEIYGPGSTNVYFDTHRMDERYRLTMNAARAAIAAYKAKGDIPTLQK